MSLFGQQPQQQQSSGLFGSTPAQGSSLFGQPQQQQQQSGGPFGQTQQQPQQQQAVSLFGQPHQQQTGGGGLFGQSTSQQPQQAGGLFNQSAQQPQQTGGLFGQTSQQLQQPQQQQGGLFGQSQQPTGALFGQQPPPQSGSLFGQLNQQAPQTGTSMLGQAAQQQLGGSIMYSGMVATPDVIQQQHQQGINPVVEKMQRVKNSWNPNHPDYAFKYYFFNHIGKERASQFQKPPQEESAAWEKAWSERPNDSCVPVRACGFKDLDLRVKVQENQVQIFRAELHAIQEKLNTIQTRHDLTTSVRLEDCRRRHMALARRALSLASKVQVLKNRGYALQPEEEALKKRLEGLAKTVQDPAATGRMNEIWARMMVVQEKAKVMEENLGKVEIVWDENQLQTAGRLLQSNFAGLQFLSKEVLAIEKSLAQWQEAQKARVGGL